MNPLDALDAKIAAMDAAGAAIADQITVGRRFTDIDERPWHRAGEPSGSQIHRTKLAGHITAVIDDYRCEFVYDEVLVNENAPPPPIGRTPEQGGATFAGVAADIAAGRWEWID